MPKSTTSPLNKFLALLKPDRKDIGYVYLYAVLIGVLALVGPLGVQAIINLIAGGAFNTSLVILVLVVTGAAVLVGALKVMQYDIAVMHMLCGLAWASLYHTIFAALGGVLALLLLLLMWVVAPAGLDTSLKESKY